MNTTTSTVILSARSDPLRLACAGFVARYAGKTLDSYRIHLELWLRWCAHVGVDPLAVRRPHVEIWLRSLEDQHLASATRAAKFGVEHLFYKYAVIDEIINRDPTQNVTRPKIHEGEQKRTWLPTLDCMALLDVAVKAGPREHVFVVLLGQMALRVGEMCALNADSVRHNQGWRTVVFRGKGVGHVRTGRPSPSTPRPGPTHRRAHECPADSQHARGPDGPRCRGPVVAPVDPCRRQHPGDHPPRAAPFGRHQHARPRTTAARCPAPAASWRPPHDDAVRPGQEQPRPRRSPALRLRAVRIAQRRLNAPEDLARESDAASERRLAPTDMTVAGAPWAGLAAYIH